MKTSLVRKLLILFILGGLSACASPAKMEAMIPPTTDETRVSENSPLKNNVHLRKISGGKATNPLWTSQVGNQEFGDALKNTLKNNNFLSEGENGNYHLKAILVNLKQELFGFSLTVVSEVEYILVDTKTGKAVLDTSITKSYTASMEDSFVAVKRLRLANEGAIRANIRGFIRVLKKKFSPDVLSGDIFPGNIHVASIKILPQLDPRPGE